MKTRQIQSDIPSPQLSLSSIEKARVLTRRQKTMRSIYIALGTIILGYIYTDSLMAQQASQQRISIIKAVDFPSDI